MVLKKIDSFRNALFLALILIGILPLLLFFGVNAVNSYGHSVAEIDSHVAGTLVLTADLLDSNLGSFSGLVHYLVNNEDVIGILHRDDVVGGAHVFEDTQKLYIETQRIMSIMAVEVPVHLVNIHEKSRFSSTDYFDPLYTGVRGDFYRQLQAAPSLQPQYYIRRRIDGDGRQIVSFSISQAVRTDLDESHIVGYVIADVYDDYFQHILDRADAHSDTQIYLLDKNGIIITDRINHNQTGFAFDPHQFQQLEGQSGWFDSMAGGVRSRLYYQQINEFGIWLVQIVPHSYFYAEALSGAGAVLPLVFVLLLTTVVMIRILGKTLSKPVQQLSTAMQTVQTGDFTVRVDATSGPGELAALGDSFNEMVGRLDELVKKDYINQVLLQEAKYESLKAQMKPHFLYNCMNMISMMVTLGESDKVVAVTQALSQYYRYNVSDISKTTTVESELQQAKRYLEIQKIRYADKLRFSVVAEETILHRHMPRLLLQPLVENAIVHGVEQILETGDVRIVATEQDRQIVIHIVDNGPGFPEGFQPGDSVGIGNAMKRLEIACDRWSFHQKRMDHHTVVTIRFALETS